MPQFESDEHAMVAGAVFAALDQMKDRGTPYAVEAVTVPNPEDHRGFDYTPFVTLTSMGKRFRVIVAEIP